MKAEAKVYQDWAKIWDLIPGFFYERIENSVSLGTPDILFCSQFRDRQILGTIELKASLDGNLKKWTNTQRTWMEKRKKAPCFLLVRNEIGEMDVLITMSSLTNITVHSIFPHSETKENKALLFKTCLEDKINNPDS